MKTKHIEPEAIERFANVFRGVKAVLIGAGNLDSMVARYTAAKKRRSEVLEP